MNNEDQCYLRDGALNTREVSNGTLKLRVIDNEENVACDNVNKQGERHPPTRYVAGRIASKNKQEFIGGRWTARLRLNANGHDGMFPAWWLLGAKNNEPPVQENDENVCWPHTGSGEIDIFEHYGPGGPDHFAARKIVPFKEGDCEAGGDWEAQSTVTSSTLNDYHEYTVEFSGVDIIFKLDSDEFYRIKDGALSLPEPLFAILNYAKINKAPMKQRIWEMEVDWVRHERWVDQ